jgi:monoamine oxidase
MQPTLDAVVAGAGVAGLAAADALLAAGLRVLVVEASGRIGGRVFTQHDFAGATIERGAEFVHGRHPGLIAEIEEAGLRLVARPFEPLGLRDGKDITSRQSWDRVFDELADPAAPDVAIAERADELVAEQRWTQAEATRLRNYVQGYNAADPARASAKALSIEARAAREIDEDGNASIARGYDALLDWLARRVEDQAALRTGTALRSIERDRAGVVLELACAGATERVQAAAVIVTLPLSLLQLDGDDPAGLRFAPPLPQKTEAARRLAMGNVLKVFLRLDAALSQISGIDDALRPKLERANFLQTPDEPVPSWWLAGQPDAPVVVGWCGGPVADRLAGKDGGEIVAIAVATLARALGISADLLSAAVRASSVADWSKEPWARGAYSWIPAGALDAAAALAAPVDGTIFFAGEATDTRGYRGTVHGAYETGRRAADELLQARAAREVAESRG